MSTCLTSPSPNSKLIIKGGDYTEIETLKRTKHIHSKVCRHNITKKQYMHKCFDIQYWKTCNYPFQMLLNNPHSNMLHIYEYHNADKQMTLVLDYCKGGDMLSYIHKHGAYSNKQTRKIFAQILKGIQHIHSLKCTHREIRSDDILLTDNTSNYIKLSDSIFDTGNTFNLYKSPQQIKNLNKNYNSIMENDVWSLGIILYIMLIGLPLCMKHDLIIAQIKNKSLEWYDESIAASAKDLIYKMLQMDNTKRLRIKQIERHPFMLGYDDIIYQNGNDIINQEEKLQHQKYTLKQKMLYALRSTKLRPIPCQKEMQESFAFFEKTQKYFKRYDVVIDVCGSHGLTAYLFAVYCRTPFIYVVDLHKPKSFDIIGKVLNIKQDTIKYVCKDLYVGLPELLQHWTAKNKKIAVIGCHACAHLSDSIMDICYKYEMTEFALMPCCHARSDHFRQIGTITDTLNIDMHLRNGGDNVGDINRKNLKNVDKIISAGIVKDMVMFGRGVQMGYCMRWKMIDAKITPHNRILFGLKANEKEKNMQQSIINNRKIHMEQNYRKITEKHSKK